MLLSVQVLFLLISAVYSLKVTWKCGSDTVIRPQQNVQVSLIGMGGLVYGPLKTKCAASLVEFKESIQSGIYTARMKCLVNSHTVDSQPFRVNCKGKIVQGAAFIDLQTFSSLSASKNAAVIPPPPLFSLKYDYLNKQVLVKMKCQTPNNLSNPSHPFNLILLFKDAGSGDVLASLQSIIRCSDPLKLVNVAHTFKEHLGGVTAPFIVLEGIMSSSSSSSPYTPAYSNPVMIDMKRGPLGQHPSFIVEPYYLMSHTQDQSNCFLNKQKPQQQTFWEDSGLPLGVNGDGTWLHSDHLSELYV